MITKKQKKVLDFIKNFNKKKGYSPALQEIKKEKEAVENVLQPRKLKYPAPSFLNRTQADELEQQDLSKKLGYLQSPIAEGDTITEQLQKQHEKLFNDEEVEDKDEEFFQAQNALKNMYQENVLERLNKKIDVSRVLFPTLMEQKTSSV